MDAILWFCEHVWPKLKARGFDGKLIIVGGDVPDEVKDLASNSIVVTGHVPDIDEIFSSCKLTIAPLRYGVGLKGKVITSLSYGVPCVTTDIGAEGSGLSDMKNILIANGPDEMCDKIIRCYTDSVLWASISIKGKAFFRHNFSIDALEGKISGLLSDLTKNKEH